MIHDESSKFIYFGFRRSKVKVTSYKIIVDVGRCTLVSAGFFEIITQSLFWSGQIVSVETLNVPIHDGVVDCDVTRWTECADTDIPCAFVLRVFYNREVNGRIYGSERVHVGPWRQLLVLLSDSTCVLELFTFVHSNNF